LWPDAAISKAAMVVAVELDKYGFETIDMAYATESASINALVQDLKKPDVEEAIASLYSKVKTNFSYKNCSILSSIL